jgi:ATP-dependent protease HslVU (ClpYQ) peptidase subunit
VTCIVAITQGGTVYMGADSEGSDGLFLHLRKDTKLCRVGAFLFGFTTSFRMGQLLRYKFQPPMHHPDVAIELYMATDWIDALRNTFKAGGFAETKDGREVGGQFLVGYKGRIFHIYSDYQVGEVAADFDACGCGHELALGAMHANKHDGPYARMRAALEAAEAFSAGVRGPFVFEEQR